MLKRLLSAAVLLLCLASRAQASTIELLLTVNYETPIVGPPEMSIGFTFFGSATNGWPGSFAPQPYLAQVNSTLLPGVTQYNVSLDAASLDNVYFNASGSYWSGPGLATLSIFVAQPPTDPVSAALAYAYGPPWISLANLGGGLSGDFDLILGYNRGPIGTWELTPATPAAPVPEPASLLLFGSGLAVAAANRYRRSRAGVTVKRNP